MCIRDSPYTVLDRSPDTQTMQVRIRERIVENDEGPRPDSTLAGLAKLKPVFAARGSVTAGNSCLLYTSRCV